MIQKRQRHRIAIRIGFLCSLILIGGGMGSFARAAENPREDLAGSVLLQVEEKGEAWYYDPQTFRLHYLGRPHDAFELLKEKAIGVRNSDLAKIPTEKEQREGDLAFRKRMAGRILLQVEDHGKAWYVYPKNLKRYYLGGPRDALRIFQTLGLGVKQEVFEELPISFADYQRQRAVSEDLDLQLRIKTKRLTKGPVLESDTSKSDWDSHRLVAGNCLIGTEDGRIAMLYYATDGEGKEQIGLAWSTNGIDWERDLGNPVLTTGEEGAWDDGGVAVFPGCVAKRQNGDYYLYYTGERMGSDLYQTGAIGLAVSKDLIHWEKQDANPLLTHGDLGAWDGQAVFEPSIIFHGDEYGGDAAFEMWYTGSDANGQFKIGYAKSNNGYNWIRISHPVLSPTGNIGQDFDGTSIEVHHVVKVNNGYVMVYEGIERPFPNFFKIGVAFSKDGKVWRRSHHNPLLEGMPSGSWDVMVLHPALFFLRDRILLYYVGLNHAFDHRIGVAEVNPRALDSGKN
jgi:predicted GH43/DUF377 family glycosyl hydrolase